MKFAKGVYREKRFLYRKAFLEYTKVHEVVKLEGESDMTAFKRIILGIINLLYLNNFEF